MDPFELSFVELMAQMDWLEYRKKQIEQSRQALVAKAAWSSEDGYAADTLDRLAAEVNESLYECLSALELF